MKKPKIAFVLSGGSALGFAHIGVIDELTQHGIEADIVTGSSMGAIVGATYSRGLNVEQMIELATKVNYWKFVDFNLNRSGMFNGRKINGLLKDAYGDLKIQDLHKTFACVAVDVAKGSVEVFKEGSVLHSVRSSMNLPAIFTPYKYKNMHFVDGGIANNLPADVAIELGADIVIGVDVLKENYPSAIPRSPLLAMVNSFYLMTMFQMREHHKLCDVLLFPKQTGVKQNSFNKTATLKSIEAGRKAAREAIPRIKEIIDNFAEYEKTRKNRE